MKSYTLSTGSRTGTAEATSTPEGIWLVKANSHGTYAWGNVKRDAHTPSGWWLVVEAGQGRFNPETNHETLRDAVEALIRFAAKSREEAMIADRQTVHALNVADAERQGAAIAETERLQGIARQRTVEIEEARARIAEAEALPGRPIETVDLGEIDSLDDRPLTGREHREAMAARLNGLPAQF